MNRHWSLRIYHVSGISGAVGRRFESCPPFAKSFHRTWSGFRIGSVNGPIPFSPFDISCFLSIKGGVHEGGLSQGDPFRGFRGRFAIIYLIKAGGDVCRVVMMSQLRWLLMGIGIGALASIALAKILQNRIWGIKSAYPLTLAAVVLVLTFLGLAARYFPARRATRVDPLVALRYE
jgi:hypothetical protein